MATGMTKTQLVRHMAEKHELSNKQAAAILDSLAEVAVKETKKSGVFRRRFSACQLILAQDLEELEVAESAGPGLGQAGVEGL